MTIQTSTKRSLLALVASVLLCAAPLSSADTLNPQGYAVPNPQSFVLSIGGSQDAGGFKGTWNSQDIVFWCIELTQFFGFGSPYNNVYTPSAPNSAVMTMLGQLFAEAYNEATSDAMHSAAFQLAIWEIVYDSGNLNLGANQGAFSVLNVNGHAETVALAQTYLENLYKYTDTYDLVLLKAPNNQDFVTFGKPFISLLRVPEPGSLALLGAALLAMVMVFRARPRRLEA